ncbi:MAG TPA: OmpH family outer membrane protein [Pirellulaceae bacterium]|nr:OmpH family outer membrane protein [Pirellulaceae bacterium]
MKALKCWTAVLAGLSVLSAAALPAWGQNPVRPAVPAAAPAMAPAASAPRPAGTSVAVIDLQEVFKQNLRFKAAMEDIKKDTEALNGTMRGEQQKLQKMVEALRDMRPGSPEYKQREEEIAHVDSEVRVKLQLQRKELREREAKLYFHAYEEVLATVGEFAERYGIALVIRFNAEEIDASNPESIMMGLNRHVVYQRKLNITDAIIAEINKHAGVADGGGTRPAIPQPRR